MSFEASLRMSKATATIIVGLILASAATAQDEVQYRAADGKLVTARGAIVDESPREVIVQSASGNKQTISVHRLEGVRYANQPAELVQTRVRERQGRWNEALDDYKKISEQVKPEQKFLIGAVIFGAFRASTELAVADPTKADEAIMLQKRFAEAFPNSRHEYAMHELLGRVHLAKGDVDAAARTFAKLAEVDWPGYKEKASVYQGIAALKKGKYDEAIRQFDVVIASTVSDEAARLQKYAAQVYKGEALVQSGKPLEAEKLLREALEYINRRATELELSEVAAIGHNALGDALRAAQKPKEALLAGYLTVAIIYQQNPEQLARALFYSAQICRQIGHKAGEEMATRRLQSEFPNSEWTKRLSAGS